MSRSGATCPGCGSSNIVDENVGCQPQLVCADCGSVLSEGELASDPVGGSDVSYRQTTAVAKKPCINLTKGLQRLKAICRTLRVHAEIEDLSQTYYTRAYQHQSFLKVNLWKKEILSGCCVVVSCRLLNWPITMETMSCLLDADPMVVGAVYVEMVKVLDIQAPLLNIADVMEAHSREYKLGPLQVPDEFSVDSKELSRRAVALLELAADSWIVTGRKPLPLMMAAVFLAWQSLRPTGRRLAVSLDKFCRFSGVGKSKPALKRVAEMRRALCTLGAELPWLRERVTPDNVARQVDDILRHRHALLRRALRTHEGTQPAEGDSEHETPPQGTASVGGGGVDPGGGQLFVPPCVSRPRKRKRAEPGPEVTGDEEISDGEIESYIRTPREAREFAASQKELYGNAGP